MDYLSTGLIAFVGIALWDVVRMCFQTWWLKKSLKAHHQSNGNYCSNCGAALREDHGKNSGNDQA